MKVNRKDYPVTVTCPFCGKSTTIAVNYEDYIHWREDTLAQHAFPYLTPTEREVFISGMCPKCQKDVFGE